MRLEATRDFPEFLEKVVEDFYPSTQPPNSWDYGQTAWRSGIGMENKLLIKQLLQDVNTIGCEHFPEPGGLPSPESELGRAIDLDPEIY